MFPSSGPGLPGPFLEGDIADRGTILVADDVAPSPGVSGPNLGRSTTNAKKSFATGSQAGNRSPILGTSGFVRAHRFIVPARRVEKPQTETGLQSLVGTL